MSHGKQIEIKADFDTIYRRLVSENEHLDRQLASWLTTQGLRPEHLDQAAKLPVAAARRNLARAQVARRLSEMPERSWDLLTRPSVETLSASFRGRLLRA